MPIIDPTAIQLPDEPELLIGIVAAVGTPLKYVERTLTEELKGRDYRVKTLHLSDSLVGLNLDAPTMPGNPNEFERISILMDRGNALRQEAGGGEALALLAAARINDLRGEPGPDGEPPFLSGHGFILRQLKHPDEVYWLRWIYGPAFHLVGIYCPEKVRRENLVIEYGMAEDEAQDLIDRDQGEELRYGQQLRETFHLSDVFVELSGHEATAAEATAGQLERYLKLIFSELDTGVITPTRDEYGMHLAYTASLRSADLSRQVGAAILTSEGEVISLGANEVPTAHGGQYWAGEGEETARDTDLGYDSNERMKREVLEEVLEVVRPDFQELDPSGRQDEIRRVGGALASKRIMNLTEFGRAVHAEMEAILSAGRIGTAIKGCQLFTTTFPCHNCAKHIVGAGVGRVIYVEPYPKSLSRELHEDAISFAEEGERRDKVSFEPFVGVAPRMYGTLFSMLSSDGRRIRRKNRDGNLKRERIGLRTSAAVTTYIDRETAAALAADRIGKTLTLEGRP